MLRFLGARAAGAPERGEFGFHGFDRRDVEAEHMHFALAIHGAQFYAGHHATSTPRRRVLRRRSAPERVVAGPRHTLPARAPTRPTPMDTGIKEEMPKVRAYRETRSKIDEANVVRVGGSVDQFLEQVKNLHDVDGRTIKAAGIKGE